jgi:hypothetical protein
MTGQRPEFHQIRVGFKEMGRQFIEVGAAVDRQVRQKSWSKQKGSHI